MKKISIIVPIYNVEQYVEKCINSLVNQTYKNIEIWAISDGSPDNSMEIIKKYAEKDSRIKYIKKENGGYGSVLEYAIKNISSEYFIICDPDDWLEPNAVEQLYNQAEKYQPDLVVGERNLIFSDDLSKKEDIGYMSFYKLEENKKYNNLTNFIFFSVSPHAKLYKTELAKQINFPHKVSYTDTILYLLYLNKAKTAVYTNKHLANYLIDRPGNTNSDLEQLSQKAFDDMIVVLNSLLDQLNKDEKNFYALVYRIYLLCLFVVKKITRDNKDKFVENKKRILEIINKTKRYKNEMKKYIRAESKLKYILKKVLFNLYYCKLTNKFALTLTITFLGGK